MKFESVYSSTHLLGGLSIAGITPGSYAGGLLSVLDEHTSGRLMAPWQWLLGGDAKALAATAFGELFFWSDKHKGAFFLDPQRGRSVPAGDTPEILFQDVLCGAAARTELLREDLFKKLEARLGRIRYGECYIAEPWAMLGGDERPESFMRGDLEVYLTLTASAIKQALDRRRRGS